MQANFCYADVEKAVCSTYGIESRVLKSRRKLRRISHPRWTICYLARQHTALSYPQIADRLRKDHTSILHGERRAAELLADPDEPRFAERMAQAENFLLASKPLRERILNQQIRERRIPLPHDIAATWC